MSSDPSAKNPATPSLAPTTGNPKGIRIFTYPKIIFIWPSAVAALICGIGMTLIKDNTVDPTRNPEASREVKQGGGTAEPPPATKDQITEERDIRRFGTPQNLMAIAFLLIFFINLLVMAIDFPRFTIIAIILLAAALGFFLLWLNVYFKLVPPVVRALEAVYAAANSGFYFLFGSMIVVVFAIIWATRYLDYWVVLPNELLHNHGPFSDLERYPTFNLKFDKEIPDILEYALLRSGRLIFHVSSERKAIVLDNVLWISYKEARLKQLLSGMEVRVANDQEAVE